MNNKYFYITTTLPYVNAKPHIGFAMEIIRADIIARYKRYLGYKVFFNTGTDEHGQKLFDAAKDASIPVQDFVNQNFLEFQKLTKALNISNDKFIRTTEDKHIQAAQKLWKIVKDNGYIYKKNYTIKYCVGCECEKQNSEIGEDGRCLVHNHEDLEVREEENYFFAFSKFQEKLLALYNSNNKFVIPDFRLLEIKSFVMSGLQDISISRLKSKMSWGIPVPDDEEHVMYVWFDALTNYISTLNWGESNDKLFQEYWLQVNQEKREVVQYCGKDNIRFQAAIWQAMLMAANIPNSTNIIIDGFIMSGGEKMSKSLGNVINPYDIIDYYKDFTEYPEEVLRFILNYDVNNFEDSDVTIETIKQSYITHLQNGLGNQVNRILKLTNTHLEINDIENILKEGESKDLEIDFREYLNDFKPHEAIHFIMDKQKALDEYIQETEPFKLLKGSRDDIEKGKEILKKSLAELLSISHHLFFFMPRVSFKIYNLVKENKMPEKPLFARI